MWLSGLTQVIFLIYARRPAPCALPITQVRILRSPPIIVKAILKLAEDINLTMTLIFHIFGSSIPRFL